MGGVGETDQLAGGAADDAADIVEALHEEQDEEDPPEEPGYGAQGRDSVERYALPLSCRLWFLLVLRENREGGSCCERHLKGAECWFLGYLWLGCC